MARQHNRRAIPVAVRQQVLMEAGYRCAVPTCRGILALDLHHIEELAEGGSDDPANLVALCPNCHALYHRGTYTLDAVRFWKGVLVSLTHALDGQAIDDLIFLSFPETERNLLISGDGVLRFTRLIAAGLAYFSVFNSGTEQLLYEVHLTPKGKAFVAAWKRGDRAALAQAETIV